MQGKNLQLKISKKWKNRKKMEKMEKSEKTKIGKNGKIEKTTIEKTTKNSLRRKHYSLLFNITYLHTHPMKSSLLKFTK